MADENILPRDQNHVTSAGFVNSLVAGDVRPGQIIVATGRVKVDSSGGGSGTVTEIDSGTGIKLTPDPITTTGTVALVDRIAPIATLGTAGQLIRVNAGATALEYFTSSASGIVVGTTTVTSGTTTRILYDNAGVVGEYTLTGSGTVVVMQTSPTLVTPVLGVATATSINKITITAPASGATLTIADGKTATFNASTTFAGTDGKTLTISNSGTLAGGDAFVLAIAAGKTLTQSNTLTYTGTDGSTVAFGAGGTVLYSASTIPLTVGSTTIASGTNTRILYDNSGVLGEYTLTGTGTVVVMATSPTFTTGLTTPQVLATANGSGSIGASGTAFTSLFLASTGTINFAAGNVVLTHSTGILTQTAGELRITSANVGTNADSVPTLSSTSTLTNKTLTSPTIQTSPVLAAATNLKFTVPSSDPSATGITTNEFNSGYSSTAIGDLVYLDSSATWQKADADASAATYSSMLGIALSVAASAAPVNVLLQGFIYASSPFPTFTIGAPIFMSATAGAMTQTAPTTTDSATRVVGYAVHADKMYFKPSNDWITHT